MRDVKTAILQFARSNLNVHIQGESGSGKERVARAIHENSMRASGPFVPVNCAALAETVLESELFGHVRWLVAESASILAALGGDDALLSVVGALDDVLHWQP